MKNIVKMLASILIVSLIAACMCATAFAAGQDGLDVAVNPNKPSYSAGETVKITVTVENKNAFDMDDVRIQHAIPGGFKQIGIANLNETINLAAHEKVTVEVALAKNSVVSPPTGDPAALLLPLLLLSLGAFGLVLLIKYNRKTGRVLSVILCLALASAAIPGALALASAAVSDALYAPPPILSFDTVSGFRYDGTSYEYKVSVSYPSPGTPDVPPDVQESLVFDFTQGKDAICFDGLAAQTLEITVASQGGDKSYQFVGYSLSELFGKNGVGAFDKIEAVASDMGTIDITGYYLRDGDILLAWGEGDPIQEETPIRVCPPGAQIANELIKNVEQLIVTKSGDPSVTTAPPPPLTPVPDPVPDPASPEIALPLTVDLLDGRDSPCFEGLEDKVITHTIEITGGSGGVRTYEGILLRDVLENLGVATYSKIEYETSDGITGEVSGDVLLAWHRVDTDSPENPIRVCPYKDAAFGNEMFQMVVKLTIT